MKGSLVAGGKPRWNGSGGNAMKIRLGLLVLMCAVVWAQAVLQPPVHETFVLKLADGMDAAAVAAQVAKEGTSGSQSLDILLKDWRLKSCRPAFCRDGHEPRDPELFRKLGLNRYLLVGWSPDSAAQPDYLIKKILGQLQALDVVEGAELNGVGHGGMVPDDPEYGAQWHHPVIGSETAWDLATGTDTLLIAVIDSGICPDNDDLDYALISNHWDYVEDDADPQDEFGHGTHVAGIMAAQTSNNTMVAGLAWNCRLLNCRVLDENNWGFYTDWAAAIEDAADIGADVLNLSLGGTDVSSLLSNACSYACGVGCFLAVAMMNDDGPVTYYPAAYGTVCAVGATDETDARVTGGWWGSNHGPHIDVVAPGNNILSTLEQATAAWSGTSMATPMVSALAALILEIRPDFSNFVVQAFIEATADDEVGDPAEDVDGFDEFMGWGRIRFDEAVQLTEVSTTCTLTLATAAVPPAAAKKLLKPYFWLRDKKLMQTPLGKKLVADYYNASRSIAPAVNREPWLMARVLKCALQYAPLIEQLQEKPGAPAVYPLSLWEETCVVADGLMKVSDDKTRELVRPWVERGKKDPAALFRELEIPVVFKEDRK